MSSSRGSLRGGDLVPALWLFLGSLLVTVLAAVAAWASVALLLPGGLSVITISVLSVVAEAAVCFAGLLLLARRWPADRGVTVAAALFFPVAVAAVTLLGTAGPLWFGLFAAVALVGSSYLGLWLGSRPGSS